MTEHITATDELRRLLDERGVEYETDDAQVSDTEWYYVTKLRDGCSDRWTYEEPPDCDLLVSYQYDLGAEEAIAATFGLCNDSCNCTNGERTGERIDLEATTLGVTDVTPTRQNGAGTCHNAAPSYLDFLCSKCGFVHYHSDTNDTGDGNEWCFCPNCGRRIEVDDG